MWSVVFLQAAIFKLENAATIRNQQSGALVVRIAERFGHFAEKLEIIFARKCCARVLRSNKLKTSKNFSLEKLPIIFSHLQTTAELAIAVRLAFLPIIAACKRTKLSYALQRQATIVES